MRHRYRRKKTQSSYTQQARRRRTLRSWFFYYLLIALLFRGLTGFFFYTLKVNSAAMQPALNPADRVIVSPLWYWIRSRMPLTPAYFRFSRGDMVTFRSPYRSSGSRRSIPYEILQTLSFGRFDDIKNPPNRYPLYLGRIVGLPGDTVELRNSVLYIKPRGENSYKKEYDLSRSEYRIIPLKPPRAWTKEYPLSGWKPALTLKSGEYYVLSDNRAASLDSRLIGPMTSSRIRGKVLLRFWPLSRTRIY